jgi:hypothetical protein
MRFLRLALLDLLIMIALLSGAILYGRAFAKPNKLQQLGFDVCNGRPCFMDLTLGMLWADARELLEKREELVLTTDTLIVLRIHDLDIGIRPDNSQTYIDDIDFNIWADNNPEISLSTIIALFGPPCSVTIITIQDMIEWIFINYPEIQFGTNGVSPNSIMTSLRLSKNVDVSYCASKKVESFRVNPWNGFRGLSYYMVDRSPEE